MGCPEILLKTTLEPPPPLSAIIYNLTMHPRSSKYSEAAPGLYVWLHWYNIPLPRRLRIQCLIVACESWILYSFFSNSPMMATGGAAVRKISFCFCLIFYIFFKLLNRYIFCQQSHEGNCPLEVVWCENKCGARIQNRYLQNHMKNECHKRTVPCPYCMKQFVFETIQVS